MMNKTIIIILALIFLGNMFACKVENKETPQKLGETETMEQKILIVYFSWSGNTRAIAQEIQKQVGGELFEIKTVKSYPSNYNECIDVAKKEQQADARPAITDTVKDFADYDVIFIGYPNWWGTLPMPLFTFLEAYDFSGKTVVPFCTHGGGRFGQSISDLKKHCPQSDIREAIAIDGNSVSRSQKNIKEWIEKIGIK